MARIDTIEESNGPDRFNLNPDCSRHQAGVRTGISDRCCCCDPCNYVRKFDSAQQPENRLCVRCIPRIILAKFVQANGDGCCRDVVVPMQAVIGDIEGKEVIEYTGAIVGYEVTVYLSNGSVSVDADPEDTRCLWTISIPYLSVYEEIEIDHYTITSLGVPAISVTNVTAFENCVGTISLGNYSTVKVPFQSRVAPDAEALSMTVPFPEGFTCEGCGTLPRRICVTKKHNREDVIRSPNVSWEIEWWREFEWNESFVPYEDYGNSEWIIGEWVHTPEDDTAFVQHLYLIQDAAGDCFIQPDFEEPAGTDGTGELFQRVPLSSCGCDFKILNVRPVGDLSPPEVPGESLPSDLAGIDYRAGRCGCWGYLCGRRRCVPKYLCGFVFVGGTVYTNILFTWSNATKSWESSGGVDLSGYDMPFSLSVVLQRGPDGSCQLAVTHEDYDITPVSIGNDDTLFAASLEGKNYAGDGFFSLNLTTSFEGECEHRFVCVTATPCADNCGSHPAVLFLTLHGYSEATDYPPPPVTGECTTEITLIYRQTVVVTGGNVLIACDYVGWALVDSYYLDPDTGIAGRATFLIKAVLSLGTLTITRRLASAPETVVDTASAVLDETCDPYYGYKLTTASLRNCFFGDSEIVWHRWEAEIVE